jgi:hypothetical protein
MPRSSTSFIAKICVVLSFAFAAALSARAAADEPLRRVFVCAGPDASMEVYLPQSVIKGSGPDNVDLSEPVIGAYALDLSAAGKGKVLERVRVSRSADGEAIIVDQYTRGLPATRVPVGGGIVDFDNRFATKAHCATFNEDPEVD